MTLGTSMAARQGPIAMAAHQICSQVWLAVSLLTDALGAAAQVILSHSFFLSSFVMPCVTLVNKSISSLDLPQVVCLIVLG